MGRTRAGLRPGAPLYSAAPEPPAHTSPAPEVRRRRSSAPPEVRRRLDFRAIFKKKNSVRRFYFRIFLFIILILFF